MKRFILLLATTATLTVACHKKAAHEHGQPDTSIPEENTPITVPGAAGVALSDTIALAANEDMRFDKELFRVHAGKKIVLLLRNVSPTSSINMAHNVVVLAKGVEIADFGDAAAKARASDYIPLDMKASMIAHTRLVNGQETDQIEFVLPATGVYDYICSFPGHWGTMQGKIIAE